MAGEAGESMSGSGPVALLRDPGHAQRSTFVELFFDLVFAFALTRLADGLIDDLKWIDVAQTALLLPAMWWVWTLTLWLNDWLDPNHLAVQLTIVVIMLGSLVMAAAVPEAFGRHGKFFATAYVVTQVGRTVFFALALRGHRLQSRGWRVLFWFGLSAVPWIAGAVGHHAVRGALWAIALGMDYLAAALNYPTPGLGRSHTEDWRLAGEHLSERYRQFVIIALGETILVTGSAFSAAFTGGGSAAAVASFVTTVLLWRIYFHRSTDLIGASGAVSRSPAGLGRLAAYTHLVIVAGIVITAVGDRIDLAHSLTPVRLAWVLASVGGPALFVAGRALFEYTVFSGVSWSRPAGLAALAALVPLAYFPHAPTLVVALVVNAILLAVVVIDAVTSPVRPPRQGVQPALRRTGRAARPAGPSGLAGRANPDDMGGPAVVEGGSGPLS
ncbi:low temperature requirement protein A [Rugosimonospora acidiphila]|uniref:Low temperature requirement protein A n=1 Tax=Rugosimonospora acidiphila TaxID=556531 RepID=A0ABP9RPN2_9ACTN